jgi:hypothetical protein
MPYKWTGSAPTVNIEANRKVEEGCAPVVRRALASGNDYD